jgi:predicted metalloprotease with PDZ domain
VHAQVQAQAGAQVHYRVELADVHAHLFRVTMTVHSPVAQQTLQLPTWIPGSYLIREFSKNLQQLRASQNQHSLPVRQIGKACWQVDCEPGCALQLQYEVYAFDNSVRTAWLDASRGFFNGTSLFLRVPQHSQSPHQAEIVCPALLSQWQLATGLAPERVEPSGFGLYSAPNYDALVDAPVEMGQFWSGAFTVADVTHRLVVSGAPDSFDGARLLADTQAICAQEIHFWHSPAQPKSSQANANATAPTPTDLPIHQADNPVPFKNYLFMLNTVVQGYGGLEHRNSTALICTRKDLPRLERDARNNNSTSKASLPEGYTTLLGLISHEYFHTWNVKRLRPAEFAHYNYSQENYTELLWFFEGFTSYYDDLLLRRAQRIDNSSYLQLLGKTINQVQQTPGRLVQSVAQASMDAWVKYYRPDENSPNATISYYTKGALVALCLDLTLRHEGRTTLDVVMQTLWQHCHGGPMTEQDLLTVLEQCAGRSYAPEIAQWVHSTQELPWAALLQHHGIQIQHDPLPIAQQLGLRVREANGIHVQHVLRGSAAENAGFASGDEWLAAQAATPEASGPWRLQSLDDLALYCGNAEKVVAMVARNGQLMHLKLSIPSTSHSIRLSVADTALANQWLANAQVQ